jgi:chemotaxis protein CheX
MLQISVEVGAPAIKKEPDSSFDISGIIGMTGDIEGSVVLSFPTATAELVVERFVGCKLARDHEDFADAIGELVNMVSGGAKAKFEGKNVSISCPTVVISSGHTVFSRKNTVVLHIPCTCECGSFAVEVGFDQIEATGESPACAA